MREAKKAFGDEILKQVSAAAHVSNQVKKKQPAIETGLPGEAK